MDSLGDDTRMKTKIEFFEIACNKKGDEEIMVWWEKHNIVKWQVVNGSMGGSSKLIVEYEA